jgi:general secretion pathway protein G
MREGNVRSRGPYSCDSAGFTLLELMMAITVVGILSALTVSSYRSYVDRANNATAMSDIGRMNASIAQFILDNRRVPNDLVEAGYDGMLDPWKSSYVYVPHDTRSRVGWRMDRRLNPINADYDLYSLGKDGVSAKELTNHDSLDDVIRANGGAFIGLAADF